MSSAPVCVPAEPSLEEPLAQRVLRQARSGQLDEDRLLPGQDKRERDLTKKLDKLAAQAGWYTFVSAQAHAIRVRLFFVDGFFTYSWAFLLADGHFSVRFARGQRPGQRPPASFGRPARPDHGARTLRSSPPPPWTFARRFGTLPWEGRCLCDGRSSDDEVLGTCLLGRVGCHQRSSSHGPTLPPCW